MMFQSFRITLICLSVCNDWPFVDCSQLCHCGISLFSPNAVSIRLHLTLAPAIAAIPRYLGLSLYAISTAFVVPMLSSLVSQYGGDHQKVSCQSCCSNLKDFEQGAVMGVFRSLGALGRALGPAFGSLLFWSLGPGTR